MREEREIYIGERSSTLSLRSTKLRWSSFIGPRLIVIPLDEGYTWIPETPSFAKVSRGRFVKSKALGLGTVLGTSLGRFSRSKR